MLRDFFALDQRVSVTPWVLSMVAALNVHMPVIPTCHGSNSCLPSERFELRSASGADACPPRASLTQFGGNILHPLASSPTAQYGKPPRSDVILDDDIDLAVFAPHLRRDEVQDYLGRLVVYAKQNGVVPLEAGSALTNPAVSWSVPRRCARVSHVSNRTYRCRYEAAPYPLSVNTLTKPADTSLGDVYSMVLIDASVGTPVTFVDFFFYGFELISDASVRWEGLRWPFPRDVGLFLRHLYVYTGKVLRDVHLKASPAAVRRCLSPPLRPAMSLCHVRCEMNESATCAAELRRHGALEVGGCDSNRRAER